MREHAIPQAVTSYEFHLIGNMTLKQFLELAGGFLIAFIIYSTNLPGVIKWPLVIFSAALGAMIAFVPFEGRPLDQWFVALLRVIYKPTEFYWRKTEKIPDYFLFTQTSQITSEPTLDLRPAKSQRISEYITSISGNKVIDPLDAAEKSRVNTVMQLFDQVAVSQVQSVESTAKPAMTVRPHTLQPFEKIFEPTVSQPVMEQTPTVQPVVAQTHPQPASPAGRLTTHTPPARNDTHRVAGGQPTPVPPVMLVETPTATAPTPIPVAPRPVEEKLQPLIPENVQVFATKPSQPMVTETAQTSTQLPFPQTPTQPNLIVGMIFNNQGGIVENAIVEILDEQGLTVRAVKTNSIGQFSISSALQNGHYTMHIEKNGLSFSPLTITLTGQIINPVEIRAQA